MRKKFLLGFGAGVLILIVLICFVYKKPPATTEQTSSESPSNTLQNSFAAPNENLAPTNPIPQPTTNATPKTVFTPTNSVEERIRTLEELGTRGDADSFQTIIAELKSSDHEVREAALSAVVQFGSQDAIPILKEIAAQTEDAREKVAILDAIDFLELPSVSEARQRRMKTNSVARPVRAK